MQELVLLLAQEFLLAFRQVDRFNIAGMLQVPLINQGNIRNGIFAVNVESL